MSATLLAVLIALGLAGGATGGWFARKAVDKPAVEQAKAREAEATGRAQEAEARVAELGEVKGVVEAAVASQLVEEQAVAGVISLDALKLVCAPPEGARDDLACLVVTACAQAKGGTVPVPACDALVNEWISERWILTIESGKADAALRQERLRIYEKRK